MGLGLGGKADGAGTVLMAFGVSVKLWVNSEDRRGVYLRRTFQVAVVLSFALLLLLFQVGG